MAEAHTIKVCNPTKRPLTSTALGQRVAVYRNLHNHCFVSALRGRVDGYTTALRLVDVTTRVRRASWRRCQAEQTRNVHAFLDGTVVAFGDAADVAPPAGWRALTYRCKDGPPCFTFRDTKACLVSAPEALVTPRGVWVPPDAVEGDEGTVEDTDEVVDLDQAAEPETGRRKS